MSTRLFERIVEEFYANNGFELCSDVVLQLDRAINQGALAKRLLNEIADELDEWHYNTSIAKVVGGSAGIGGAIAGMMNSCHNILPLHEPCIFTNFCVTVMMIDIASYIYCIFCAQWST